MILGVICARGGSKGLPRKALKLLAGKSLLAYALECSSDCCSIDRVVVSTDDEEIAAAARSYGAEVPFIRPASLAQDTSPKWPVFQHLVQAYEAIQERRVEVLVDLDVGVPLREPADVESCIRKLLGGDADVVTTGYEAERNPYFNMVELDREGFAHMSKPRGAPITRRQDAPLVYSLSPAVFAVRRDVLWKCEHWSQAKLMVHVMPRERAVDIDSEVDFRLVEALLQAQQSLV